MATVRSRGSAPETTAWRQAEGRRLSCGGRYEAADAAIQDLLLRRQTVCCTNISTRDKEPRARYRAASKEAGRLGGRGWGERDVSRGFLGAPAGDADGLSFLG